MIRIKTMAPYDYLILGGGVVAGYAAQAFAEEGLEPQQLAIISEDDTLPYERPPLSKDYLAGDKEKEEILINDPEFYSKHGIETFLNTRVAQVDFQNKELVSEEGQRFGYKKLLIATGSRLNRLDVDGADGDGIYYLRWLDNASAIRRHAEQAKRGLVVGGGFIGMETAAVLASRGVETTWVFPDEQPMAGFFTPQMAEFFMNRYREEGVTLIPNAKVRSFQHQENQFTAMLDSGKSITAEMAILGVGVKPALQLFKGTDLQIEDGILVNEFLETNLPDVYAAGDVVNYRDVIFDKHRHIEHWDNAMQQGSHVASVMAGNRKPFEHVPYFFSDEFDISWEFWGDTADADRIVHRGDVSGGSFSTWWLKEGRLVGAFVLDRPDEEREAAQSWIRERAQLSADLLADEERSLAIVHRMSNE
jgi:NADPH-dependent 2,4-dienoyl-CoA reductase/sulfur reductase-like enzyme